MNVNQNRWTRSSGWTPTVAGDGADTAQLVLVFGETSSLRNPEVVASIRKAHPTAYLMGCSTAGEICGTTVANDSVVVTAVTFEHIQLRKVRVQLDETSASMQAGARLAQALPVSVPSAGADSEDKLVHVFVLSDGLHVNGSNLVRGLVQHLPPDVTVTGGLAGDGERFAETLVFTDGVAQPNAVVALGLYGRRLTVGFGFAGRLGLVRPGAAHHPVTRQRIV